VAALSNLAGQNLQDSSSGAEHGQASKLETLGRLAGGVAHDFANILTLIAGYSQILSERCGTGGSAEVEEIRLAAKRGGALVDRLLRFARADAREPQILPVNTAVCSVERMLRPIFGERFEFRLNLSLDAGKVLADPVQLDQALMNLALNARDAMPLGGPICIETRNSETGLHPFCAGEMAPGPCVLLTVSDSGHGIAPAAMLRIFEPFFTTKPAGKGAGLGLSIVLETAQRWGGAVWAESQPGLGASFHLCLPRVMEAEEAGGAIEETLPARGGGETLLLVEDDDGVRGLLARLLRRNGYRVVEAWSGEEGLAQFRERSSEIGLAISDIVMPGMEGPELATRLRTLRPGLPVVLISGYPEDVWGGRSAWPSGIRLLRKPIRPEALERAVRESLDSALRPFNPQ
jgi:nitrogen-specific signal transduction histidine kinase/CheY-like chemotaxis protein